APPSSMMRRVRAVGMSGSVRSVGRRELWPGRVQDGGPDGRVGGDEEDVAARAAEGEVDGAGKVDLADQVALRTVDLDAGERRGIDAPRGVDLDPVREARSGDGEESL